jgi:hypothetical protein
MVLTAAFREFFEATTAAAGSLTGLLFVALTVTKRDKLDETPGVIQQVRAAAALLAFVNSLAVSLFALAPGTGVRWPTAVLGVIGLMFTAAASRTILSDPSTVGYRRRQVGLLNLMVLIFGTELVSGVILIVNSHSTSALDALTDALVVSLLVGIARAWEFVGAWDTGFLASLSVLTNRQAGPLNQRAFDGTGERVKETGQPVDGAGQSAGENGQLSSPEAGDPRR